LFRFLIFKHFFGNIIGNLFVTIYTDCISIFFVYENNMLFVCSALSEVMPTDYLPFDDEQLIDLVGCHF